MRGNISSHFSCSVSRRQFLQSSGLAMAALLTAPPFELQAQPGGGGTKGRRIGFVDDHLNNYHANVFLQALRGPLKHRGYEIAGCTGIQKTEGRAWAEKNQVPWFDTVAALNSGVDFYMVLAPSTPETHWGLCQAVLPFKKPAYIDKTFAPDLATAQKIFALADEHGTPIQTSSALRYTNIQDELKKLSPARVEHMITWGGGGSFAEYAIHPLELLISIMGPDATALMRRGPESRSQLLINFEGDRTAVVNVYTQSTTPFAASVTTEKATHYFQVDVSQIFVNNLAATLDFFEAGEAQINRRESLLIMKILDAAKNPKSLQEFVPLI